ncbi:hypothetical protein D3C83_35560 [compost metagenome]
MQRAYHGAGRGVFPFGDTPVDDHARIELPITGLEPGLPAQQGGAARYDGGGSNALRKDEQRGEIAAAYVFCQGGAHIARDF